MPDLHFPDLSTERLRLRALRPGDATELLALYADAEVMRHWIHPPWSLLAQAQAAIDEAQRDLTSGRALHLAIEARLDGRLVGSCALYDFAPEHRRATLGYLLAAPYWGKGMARETLQALLGYGIGTLGLERIEAEVTPHNVASQSLLARLGFLRERRLHARWHVGGATRDVDLWAFTLACHE
ncbi:GNAT family N-acetyltransferase [Massilia arenae]|uniref:GNAT family N-acetyltransferase n=1 Tax=Massilia arenae TaxID=2603288 RepID=A0A5C7G2G9_9BURK|nr:GNAT family N-acetyltransferase [Massilia arenae]TXF97458.1 GNAT family N-acetyltransferase [Massilia arenae]